MKYIVFKQLISFAGWLQNSGFETHNGEKLLSVVLELDPKLCIIVFFFVVGFVFTGNLDCISKYSFCRFFMGEFLDLRNQFVGDNFIWNTVGLVDISTQEKPSMGRYLYDTFIDSTNGCRVGLVICFRKAEFFGWAVV